ncbi:hypothetical protein NP233_g8022 [Leucocoprinus birnbaumii]|uniref:Acid phosphatase n=1 Tax=Leucocoprinus birnbaumii TaxID=56174 RepID=A0AAD5YS90_9AGAR|nr:hypothetical protein NP233_g8022 [Leucocoprinus birnbaumii]
MRLISFALAVVALVLPAAALHFENIFIMVFENTRFEETIADPNFRNFANKGILYSNWVAITHPSQPNYVYITSGSTQGVDSDDLVSIPARNIVDLLEERGFSWKSYEEGYPGNCFLGINSGRWAQKHSLTLFYQDVHTNPQRCAKVVEGGQLLKDIAKGKLPDVAFYTPDLDNDAHDTDVTFAGKYLKNFLKETNIEALYDVVLITFDESSPDNNGNHIYTAVGGRAVTNRGLIDNTALNHGSILKSMELNFKLGSLVTNDTVATPFTVW